MMNTSSKDAAGSAFTVPVSTFLYRDTRDSGSAHDHEGRRVDPGERPAEKVSAVRGPSAQEVSDLVSRARAEAIAETELRLKQNYESKVEAQASRIGDALQRFAEERKSYFARVEGEVVQLALAIAAKILHRESQVDPMLVAGLVRVAVDRLHDNSKVTVRVALREAAKWRAVLPGPAHGSTIDIIEDPHLGADDCVLETELGSANFSLDAQMKEVEQGFFDLLAQRPVIK